MKKDRAREIVQFLMADAIETAFEDDRWSQLLHRNWRGRFVNGQLEPRKPYRRLHHTTARPKDVATRPKNRARG